MYIGQSGRTLKHRLSEHQWALQNGDLAASALAEHTWSTGHRMDLPKAEVVDGQPFNFVTTWCLLENWHIQRHPHTLNRERVLWNIMLPTFTSHLDLLSLCQTQTEHSAASSCPGWAGPGTSLASSCLLVGLACSLSLSTTLASPRLGEERSLFQRERGGQRGMEGRWEGRS